MKSHGAQFLLAFIFLGPVAARASNLDTIGVTLLRTVTTNINGTNICVGQAEGGAPYWEVNPGSSAVGHPTNLFTYFYSASPYTSVSTANTFTNSLGLESGHADNVAGNFYGMSGGVATNVTHVDNYEAATLYYYYVYQSSSITDRVVNQSFIFCTTNYSHLPVSTEQQINQKYDNYAAQYEILFVSGAGNGGPTNQAQIYPPASCYNGIGVAAYGGSSCIGPTLDNGRAKPDITAPAIETSYSTPQVAGAATVMEQAGLRGDGGSDTNSAADIRTVKALLLNGAIKPADWTNGAASPLDARYGAGVLNVFNSYKQLAGQKQTNFVSASVSTGAAHPPTGATNTIGVLSGWNFTSLTSSPSLDAVAHYYFNVTNGVSNATFTATATLVWNRQQNKSSINNLHLFLYNAANSNLVAVCTSAVDNVQHLFVPKLPPGRYDLQVFKSGGAMVSTNETYALAFEFFSTPLNIASFGTNVVLKWPIYPAGFVLQGATNLAAPVWNTNNPAPAVTNGQNSVTLGATNSSRFFRLRRP
ncbi:MAG: S8 family serine peptidase [Verrucomicrobiota bacterium]